MTLNLQYEGGEKFMNIAFFLLPKSEVAWISLESTMRQAIEELEQHPYRAVPLVAGDGSYAGTLSEGDLLWELKKRENLSLKNLENIPLEEVERHFEHETVSIYENIQALLSLALDQSFVPVVDDQGVFIGIVTRKAVIEFFAEEYMEEFDLKTAQQSNNNNND